MSEGTEEPTDHKLEEAIKKGDKPHSKDFTAAASMLAWWALIIGMGGTVYSYLQAYVARLVSTSVVGSLRFHAVHNLWTASVAIAIPVAIGLVIVLVLELAQTRGAMASKRDLFDFNRINPVSGFKQIFSMQRSIELLASLLRFAVICAIAWVLGTGMFEVLTGSADRRWFAPLLVLEHDTMTMLGLSSLFCLAMGGIDVFVQRLLWKRRNRMKKEEITREHKEQQGDPQTRGTRRSLHQELLED